jgi:hypothetical protein
MDKSEKIFSQPNLEELLEPFTLSKFSASAVASKFFLENADSEVQRKLNDLASLQAC